MKRRKLRMTIPTHRVLEGGGFPVRRPAAMGQEMSPFLLLDEMGPVDWGPNEAIGAPAHPHRGFETVTYLLEGRMQHEDSAGNRGNLEPGDVQWMTAGRGVIHSELPHPEFLESGGRSHGFQIWVNLPAKDKMMAPRYQDIPATKIPQAVSLDGKVSARVLAGECLGVSAVIETVISITCIHLSIHPGGSIIQPIGVGENAMIYVFEGQVIADESTVKEGQLGILTDGEEVSLSVPEDAKGVTQMLILAGDPINEPIARYGPFVMNTNEEIRQAIIDYQNGTLTMEQE